MSVFLSAVHEATFAVPRRYPTGSVPKSPTYPYLVYSVAGDRAEAYTLDASHGVRFYRVIFQSFGRTLQSALDVDAAATEALLDRAFDPIDLPFYDCGPCRLEVPSAIVRDPDAGGVLGVTTTLTFTATPEE